MPSPPDTRVSAGAQTGQDYLALCRAIVARGRLLPDEVTLLLMLEFKNAVEYGVTHYDGAEDYHREVHPCRPPKSKS